MTLLQPAQLMVTIPLILIWYLGPSDTLSGHNGPPRVIRRPTPSSKFSILPFSTMDLPLRAYFFSPLNDRIYDSKCLI